VKHSKRPSRTPKTRKPQPTKAKKPRAKKIHFFGFSIFGMPQVGIYTMPDGSDRHIGPNHPPLSEAEIASLKKYGSNGLKKRKRAQVSG
jgi:hypothetical protein